jgi:hypothetical protein
MESLIAWIAQTFASSLLAILAFIAVRSTAIGERFLNHHLAKKIADLEHAHAEKIEALRADLAHLQDRGRRANELEFDAASKIWYAFVDAHMKAQQAILDYISIPDLNKMSAADVATFLESTEFSSQQRKQVLDVEDKVRMYSKVNRLRNINKAGTAIYEGRLLLRTSGIFLSAKVAKAFKDGFEMLSFAQVEQQLDFEGRGIREQPKSAELLGAGGELLLSTLETLVRSTIRRD